MSREVWLAAALPALPAAAGLAGLLLPHRSRRGASALAVTATALASFAAVLLAVDVLTGPAQRLTDAGLRPPVDVATPLADFGTLVVTLGVRVDSATAIVALAVCAVALAVQVYSIGYLAGDRRFAPYAAQVSLFTAAMLLVVVSADLVTLLVGWEVMGICSYLLIGHDRSLPEAPAAAVKAFLVTRVGDVGFLLGVVVLGVGAGSFRIAEVLDAAADGRLATGTIVAACMLLLAGVAGKSAQFPLHTWLPDAMAGPTPISALIHAATMVAAGVYVVARLYPLYTVDTLPLVVLGVVAAVTMLLGAYAALAQDDIKRVLAWSTVSQLAYMTGALAVGSPPAALFHLLTHAAFKALLFLAAGAVIHAVATNAMSGMGGLRRTMPVTFVATTIGLAALVGIPPLAGFWSKESVLGAADRAAHGEASVAPWVGWLVLLAGLLTVVLTGAYAARLWLRTFFGRYRGSATPHDPPGVMRWPVVALAVPAALFGFAVLWAGLPVRLGADAGWYAYAPAGPPGDVTDSGQLTLSTGVALTPELGTTALALAAAALGVLLAVLAWRADPALLRPRTYGPLARAFARGLYLDEVQDALVVRPVRALARGVTRIDVRGVDGLVEGAGRGAVRLGRAVAAAHAGGLGRYVTAAVGGGALLALLAAVVAVVAAGAIS